MAPEDKTKWNAKHQLDLMPQEPLEVVRKYARSANRGKALDIACGNGRHSLYLASIGFQVEALDISSVAIERLRKHKNIQALEVDLDHYRLEKSKYDLIVKTYFLERKLLAQTIDALKDQGIIILETFMHHRENERKTSNPAFRLYPGELEDIFAKRCEFILYEEFWDRDYRGFRTLKVRMVAKKLH